MHFANISLLNTLFYFAFAIINTGMGAFGSGLLNEADD